MTGIEALRQSLGIWSCERIGQWLECGLRTLADEPESEDWSLAFSPLLLERGEPALQQFHFALEQVGAAGVSRVRAATGDLLRAWRIQDSAAYLTKLWSVALSLKPVGGVLDAARHFTGLAGGDRRSIERVRPAINVMITTVLAYPGDEGQNAFLSDLAKTPVWIPDYSRQCVLHHIRQSPSRWLEWVREYEPAVRESPDAFFARLARTVGPSQLGSSLSSLTEGLEWLFGRLKPHFEFEQLGGLVRVRIGSAVALIDEEIADTDDLIQVEIIARAMEPNPGQGLHRAESRDPELRLSQALSRIPTAGPRR